jgi:hypothetical protein
MTRTWLVSHRSVRITSTFIWTFSGAGVIRAEALEAVGSWVRGFAEVGEQLTQPSADGGVSFHLTRPSTFDGVIDQLLFTSESGSQSRGIVTGGEELGAAEVEVALARGLLVVSVGSGRALVRS